MKKTVGELKSPALFTVRADDSLDRAADYLISTGVSGAPVLDEAGRPLGVISLSHLLTRRSGELVSDRMTRPAITAPEDEEIVSAAHLMARSGVPRLIIVDPEGRASGVLTALDVIGALLGVPTGADCFPHHDDNAHVNWTEDLPLEMAELGVAPCGPGLLALVRGGKGVEVTVVWSEASNNVRKRLWDIVSRPEHETPQLARLVSTHRDLRFRAAFAPDPEQRKRALGLLQVEALRCRPTH